MLYQFYFTEISVGKTRHTAEAWQKLSTAGKLNLSPHITSPINYAVFINQCIYLFQQETKSSTVHILTLNRV